MSGKSYFPKGLFNAAFLVINIIILVANFSTISRSKDEPQRVAPVGRAGHVRRLSAVKETGGEPPRSGWAKDINASSRGRLGASAAMGKAEVNPLNRRLQPTSQRSAMPWDNNWDSRQGAGVRRGNSGGHLRRLWLVRHGDYYRDGPKQGHLTEKGKAQVEKMGKRLQEIGVSFNSFVSSTSVRCRETTAVISKFLPATKFEWSDLVKEGRPVYPDPGFPGPVPHDKSFEEDGRRLDAAFKKYIHRGDTTRNDVTNDLIVTHGNVIGYFTLRGLQVPAERWLKVQVIQGSISMYEITPDGHFNVRILGDMGHIPVSDWSG